ncbi:MAG: DUF5689 domain-containing protein [Bacteroidales bacterium]|jgi:hypothetical protein|nr:DUF5689 domain-containing protein [Bacteroidales bacterium]
MKKYLLLIVVLFLALTSCDKRNYDVPSSMPTSAYQTTSEIITIADLKEYALQNPGMAASNSNANFGYLQDPLGRQDENGNVQIIPFPDKKALKGIIVGNDESGNIYKQMYLQDPTGAILLTVNLTGMFGSFQVGQEVIVELQGLCIGRYYGAFQVGSPVLTKSISSSGQINWNMSRMTPYDFYNHVFRNGDPDLSKVIPNNLTSIPASVESIRNTLVHFDNVSFIGGGTRSFAPLDANGDPATGTVELNVGGARIEVRTSGYANFAGDTVPAGVCSVTAILSQYFENLQITLRTREDIVMQK